MNAPANIEVKNLPALVRAAAQKLASAENSAEILEARDRASAVYDMAKSAGRIARAKQAHDEIISVVYRAQADALEIESLAKHRLADEYDAAQDGGEVAKQGRPKKGSASEPFWSSADEVREGTERFVGEMFNGPAKLAEIQGLSKKDIHEARQIRDAEVADPGVVRRTLDSLIEAGEAPTKAALKREIAARPEPRVADDSLWLWGRLRDFEAKRILAADPRTILLGMTGEMRGDVRRLVPLVREFLEELEVTFEPA